MHFTLSKELAWLVGERKWTPTGEAVDGVYAVLRLNTSTGEQIPCRELLPRAAAIHMGMTERDSVELGTLAEAKAFRNELLVLIIRAP